MNFDLSDEQQLVRASVLSFGLSLTDDDMAARDREGRFSRLLWNQCARFGIQGWPIDPAFGGRGGDPLMAVVAQEALGFACRDNGLLFAIAAQMWSVQLPILRHGTAQQHATYLPRLSSGEWIGAHAMSEPDAGSDAFALRTRATGGSAGYVLNGVKSFVSQAPLADVFVVFATTEPDAGAMGITAFLVERSAPGLHVGPPLDKLGLRTSPMAMLHLTDCAVPASNVLGRVGRGASVFLEAMEWERAAIMASAVGTMQRVVDEAARMVRRAGVHSGSSQRVVDMRVRLECSRLALYRAVWAKCRSEVAPELPSIAKLVISDAFVRNTQDALSVRAACGDVGGEDWERMLRDAIGGLLYSGTNEIQRRIIARSMSLPVD